MRFRLGVSETSPELRWGTEALNGSGGRVYSREGPLIGLWKNVGVPAPPDGSGRSSVRPRLNRESYRTLPTHHPTRVRSLLWAESGVAGVQERPTDPFKEPKD